MDPALVPDFEGRYLENEKRFFKNNFETVFWGPNSIIRNQLVKTLQLTFKSVRFSKNRVVCQQRVLKFKLSVAIPRRTLNRFLIALY